MSTAGSWYRQDMGVNDLYVGASVSSTMGYVKAEPNMLERDLLSLWTVMAQKQPNQTAS